MRHLHSASPAKAPPGLSDSTRRGYAMLEAITHPAAPHPAAPHPAAAMPLRYRLEAALIGGFLLLSFANAARITLLLAN